jgi:hypothetical protein
MKNALAMFYLKQNGPAPLPERYWRVPDAMVAVSSNGMFTAELEPGEYYVGVVGRQSSKIVPGPPMDGDFLILVKDKNGNPKIISLDVGETIKVGTQKGSVFKTRDRNKINITDVEGRITRLDGTPVSGAYVFAFHSPERGTRPIFVSDKSGKNGSYVLRVDGDGPYYLKVRESYGGGKPNTGELMGTFGGDEQLPIVTKTGSTLKGIDIIVQPVERPGGR